MKMTAGCRTAATANNVRTCTQQLASAMAARQRHSKPACAAAVWLNSKSFQRSLEPCRCRLSCRDQAAMWGTIFSPSPIHLLVSEEAEMLKKVALMLLAMALPISVLPVPGGPNSSRPLGGARAPCSQQTSQKLLLTPCQLIVRVAACLLSSRAWWPAVLLQGSGAAAQTRLVRPTLKMWGFMAGQQMTSWMSFLAASWPAMSSQATLAPACSAEAAVRHSWSEISRVCCWSAQPVAAGPLSSQQAGFTRLLTLIDHLIADELHDVGVQLLQRLWQLPVLICKPPSFNCLCMLLASSRGSYIYKALEESL